MQNDNLLIYAYREKIPFVHNDRERLKWTKPKERKKEKKKP